MAEIKSSPFPEHPQMETATALSKKISAYSAHIRDDGAEQTLLEHLTGTAELASAFAAEFGEQELARAIALAHDIGKYSSEFQQRLRGSTIKVNHSTAGAIVISDTLKNKVGLLAAYCVMGHHGGLPDGGSMSQPDVGTLHYRLKGDGLPDYSKFSDEVKLAAGLQPASWMPDQKNCGFSLAFFIRMLFSALVDADWLDTEKFMTNGAIARGEFESVQSLRDKLAQHIKQFGNPKREMDSKRNELLDACISRAQDPKGLFSLTAPTGSGKTLSSMAFALNHAAAHNMGRVIYVVPYNTIIEQNAKVFEDILGAENVVQHHSNIDYGDEDKRRFATENWDAPIIVTSNVQFFESLFANKPGACRKLHNIANSVIVFDEAQMLPLPHLLPCVAAIKELAANCRCTAVLATATQSGLDEYFEPLPIREINQDPPGMYEFFRRVSFSTGHDFSADELVERLSGHEQVLCIVNTRKKAQELAGRLAGSLHLSTTMYPAHRSKVLSEIRKKLKDGETCRVISTSLLEAGVDVDFPALYREKAGLDSIIQAAGRCNREGGNTLGESFVYVFMLAGENLQPNSIRQNIAAYEHAARKNTDIASLEAVKCYFEQLRYIISSSGLDKNEIVQQFNKGVGPFAFPFKKVAQEFNIIEKNHKTIIIGCDESEKLCRELRLGIRTRQLMRRIQQYSVSLYPGDIKKLQELGQLEALDDELSILAECFYDESLGVTLGPDSGNAIII